MIQNMDVIIFPCLSKSCLWRIASTVCELSHTEYERSKIQRIEEEKVMGIFSYSHYIPSGFLILFFSRSGKKLDVEIEASAVFFLSFSLLIYFLFLHYGARTRFQTSI